MNSRHRSKYEIKNTKSIKSRKKDDKIFMTFVWAKFLNYDAKKHMPQKIGTLHFIKIKSFCCLNYSITKKKEAQKNNFVKHRY